MLRPQETRFWQAVLQAGLVDADRMEACWEQIPPEKRTPDAIDRRLARKLVEDGLLTRWQGQQLLGGVRPQALRYDRYALLDVLGQGGMGRVFLARDTRLNRLVALKILSRDRINNPRAVTRFRREARVGAQLQHENLVRIYDEGEAEGHFYLVMEYIDGKAVSRLIAEHGPVPAAVAARFGFQIASGPEHAREKGLVHRDVNPQNVLVGRDGNTKLADMGLAIDLSDQGEAVTRDGATVGTFDYISPEQARNSRDVDTRSDLYSLGCTLYHMLAGRVPFPQPSLPEKLFAHQMLDPDPIGSVVKGVPDGLALVVRRMMAKRPEDRYSTPREAAEDLKPFMSPAISLEAIETAPEVEIISRPEGALQSPDGTTAPKSSVISSDIFASVSRIETGPVTPLSDTKIGIKRDITESSRKRLVWLGAAAGLAFLVILLTILFRDRILGSFSPGDSSQRDSKRNRSPVVPGNAPPAEGGQHPLIAVHWLDDDTEVAEETLVAAIQKAAGKHAEVRLRDSRPIELTLESQLVISSGVAISAQGGTRPVVKVRWNGSESGAEAAIHIRLDGRLRIHGITFECEPEGNSPRATLIEAVGELGLEKSTFRAMTAFPDFKVVAASGQQTTISGCAFRGFNVPLRFEMLAGCTDVVSQCLFVAPPTSEPMAHWAIVLSDRQPQGQKKTRKLKIDHCTIVDSGLLAIEDADAENPVEIEVKNSVVMGPGLLAWTGGETAFPSGLRWNGQDNRYDIAGPAWVVTGIGSTEQLPLSPEDLNAWRLATGSEDRTRLLKDALKQLTADSTPIETRPTPAFVLPGPDATIAGINPKDMAH